MRPFVAYALALLLIINPLISYAVDNCGDADPLTWCIESSDTDVDGDSDCSGQCGENFVMIIEPRTLGLELYNFDHGSAENEVVFTNPDDQVVCWSGLTGSYPSNIYIHDSKHYKILGNNYSGATYGIRLEGTRGIKTIDCWPYELGYIEGNGARIADNTTSLTASTEKEDIYIHDLYFHNLSGEAIYYGKNDATPADYPYFKDIIIERIKIRGAPEGIQLNRTKGTSYIRDCDLENTADGYDSSATFGYAITATRGHEGTLIIERNRIHDAGTPGVDISDCIKLKLDGGTATVRNNMISQCGDYGIDVSGSDGTKYFHNNSIVDYGDHAIRTEGGETDGEIIGNLISDTGGDYIDTSISSTSDNYTSDSPSSLYVANLSEGDLSPTYLSPFINSMSTAGPSTDYNENTRPYGLTDSDAGAVEFIFKVADIIPEDDATGVSTTIDPTWKNPYSTTGVDVYFDQSSCPAGSPTKEVSNQDVETYDPGTLLTGTTYCMRVDPIHADGTETGDNIEFTTAGGPPPDPTVMGGIEYSSSGGGIEYSSSGGGMK